jgi:ATP-dependent protease ClpP protease subunit
MIRNALAPIGLCLFLAGITLVSLWFPPERSTPAPTPPAFWEEGIPVEEFLAVTRDNPGWNSLNIRGPITDGIVARVKNELNKSSLHPIRSVFLDSPGGSVDAGIALGRLLREQRVWTSVLHPNQCISSCIFALAGGAYREPYITGYDYIDARVGIHRPYLIDTSLTTSQVQKAATDIEAKVRAYFREMNISQRLVDDMMVIPSNQVRWLSASDIDLYGLLGSDPVIEEARILAGAKQLGISRAEFERREEQAVIAMNWNSCLDALPCSFRALLKDLRKSQCRARGGCQ